MKRIVARYLYTLETPEPVMDGFVEYEDDGTILRTGQCTDGMSYDNYYDGAVVPGFVNAHCHIELSHLQGKFRKGTGMAGFIDQINELRDSSSREDKIAAIRRWMDILWRQGVSAMADISNCDDSFGIKAASPMYTRTFLEVFGTEPEDCNAVMDSVSGLEAKAREYGLDAAPTPHSCYTMSPELLSAASAAGLKSGYLSYHSQESPEEEEMIMKGSGPMWDNRRRAGMSTPPVTGKPSLMYFLDRLMKVHQPPFDEHILLVHNVCLTQDAVDAAAGILNNVYWAVCPMSNIFIHDALPPVPLMRRNGLKITVGTDSLSSNDTLDMVRELYCLQSAFPDIPSGELYIWACRNGAEFLAMEDMFGTVGPGKRPGLVFVDGLDSAGRLTAESTSMRIV